MKKFILLGISIVLFLCQTGFSAQDGNLKGNTLFTALKDIFEKPAAFENHYVSIQGTFEGWRGADGPPPETRSDWVVRSMEGLPIYCSGNFPHGMSPNDPLSIGRMINVLGKVSISRDGRPYIAVSEALPLMGQPEIMVSVSQILFDPVGMQGKRVTLLGVLAKGYGPRGNRIYLLADPSGAITLERLPKLYPKGTILQIKGTVGNDENGLPQLFDVEIVSAKI